MFWPIEEFWITVKVVLGTYGPVYVPYLMVIMWFSAKRQVYVTYAIIVIIVMTNFMTSERILIIGIYISLI